jgi:protein-arginine deiminase
MSMIPNTRTVCLAVGRAETLFFPCTSGQVGLEGDDDAVAIDLMIQGTWQPLLPGQAMPTDGYDGRLRLYAARAGQHRLTVIHSDEATTIKTLDVDVYAFTVCLDVDADRDGKVDENNPEKGHWRWGKDGTGAVVLVNSNRDAWQAPQTRPIQEFCEIVVRATGVPDPPEDMSLVLYATERAATRFAVFRIVDDGRTERMLGVRPPGSRRRKKPEYVRFVSRPLSFDGETLYLTAFEYPSSGFEGLITLELHLRIGRRIIATDRVVVRVAPWLMVPAECPVEKAFTCLLPGKEYGNAPFVKSLQEICDEVDIPLQTVQAMEYNGDRWIQDSVEFGYSETPTHRLPVVCESPFHPIIADYAEEELRGPGLGHISVRGNLANSLDSFGNLEVSPRVGSRYPLGRIIFGGKSYGTFPGTSRAMMPKLRGFLYAQKAQSPFELFTDWLVVGHVDELVSFVRLGDDDSFKVLIVSPRRTREILEPLRQEYGGLEVFEGLKIYGEDVAVTINQLLDDSALWSNNRTFQNYIDQNRQILMRELQLRETEIVEVPALFKSEEWQGGSRAVSYMPNMVNHLVLNDVRVVPDPHGPIIPGDSECVFRKEMRRLLEPMKVRFLDDWYNYHQNWGNVHCATNAMRTTTGRWKWWECKPDGAFDV